MFDQPKVKISKVVVHEPPLERFSAIQDIKIEFDTPKSAIKHLFDGLNESEQREMFMFFASKYLDEQRCNAGRLETFSMYCMDCGARKDSKSCCKKYEETAKKSHDAQQ